MKIRAEILARPGGTGKMGFAWGLSAAIDMAGYQSLDEALDSWPLPWYVRGVGKVGRKWFEDQRTSEERTAAFGATLIAEHESGDGSPR